MTLSLELGQLWRCPVSWCTIWKGTPQDCVDHMQLAHAVPATVNVANLGRWVPPWMVSRNIWREALHSSVSGVSTDALLFSRYGIPLVHRYRVFSRYGTHISLRGTYMARLRDFIEQSDAESRTLRKQELARSLRKCLWMVHVEHADGNRQRNLRNVSLVGLCPRYRRLLLPQLRKLLLLRRSIRASTTDVPPPLQSIMHCHGFLQRTSNRGRFNWCGLQHRSIRLLRLRWPPNPCALI